MVNVWSSSCIKGKSQLILYQCVWTVIWTLTQCFIQLNTFQCTHTLNHVWVNHLASGQLSFVHQSICLYSYWEMVLILFGRTICAFSIYMVTVNTFSMLNRLLIYCLLTLLGSVQLTYLINHITVRSDCAKRKARELHLVHYSRQCWGDIMMLPDIVYAGRHRKWLLTLQCNAFVIKFTTTSQYYKIGILCNNLCHGWQCVLFKEHTQ